MGRFIQTEGYLDDLKINFFIKLIFFYIEKIMLFLIFINLFHLFKKNYKKAGYLLKTKDIF